MFDTFDAIYICGMTALMSWVFDPASAAAIVGIPVILSRIIARMCEERE